MMRWVNGGVTVAEGFKASGVSAGIKLSRKPDLALVLSDTPCTAAGVFTKNRIKAAPVLISAERLRKKFVRGVLINSGCANCMTGKSGINDARELGKAVTGALGISEDELLMASTGIIGRRLPVSRMVRAIPHLVQQLSVGNHEAASEAILTTDARIKEAAFEAAIGGRIARVGGMAKGSGMISPSMATMICVITTDVSIDASLLSEILRQGASCTFNRISVDGDMSTNDTVFALANGCSGLSIKRASGHARAFSTLLHALMARLAKMLIEDGEGATRIMEIQIVGARSDQEAQACARQVADSLLVKTMLAGSDPNVGRIAAAVGASSARFNADELEVRIGRYTVVRNGEAVRLEKSLARQLLSDSEVKVRIDLHAGHGEGCMLSCDLTEEYVRINARYST